LEIFPRDAVSLSLGLKKRGTRQEEGGGPLMLQLGRRYRFWHNNSDEVDEVTMPLAFVLMRAIWNSNGERFLLSSPLTGVMSARAPMRENT
jgi:hypothetical protein